MTNEQHRATKRYGDFAETVHVDPCQCPYHEGKRECACAALRAFALEMAERYGEDGRKAQTALAALRAEQQRVRELVGIEVDPVLAGTVTPLRGDLRPTVECDQQTATEQRAAAENHQTVNAGELTNTPAPDFSSAAPAVDEMAGAQPEVDVDALTGCADDQLAPGFAEACRKVLDNATACGLTPSEYAEAFNALTPEQIEAARQKKAVQAQPSGCCNCGHALQPEWAFCPHCAEACPWTPKPPIEAQPSGCEAETWLIFFEDQDVPPELFTDESAARERYTVLSRSWNCHLFRSASPCSCEALREENERLRSKCDDWYCVNCDPDHESERESLRAENERLTGLLTERVADLDQSVRVGVAHAETAGSLRAELAELDVRYAREITGVRAELAKAKEYAEFEESRIVALCEAIGAEDAELAAEKVRNLRAELATEKERADSNFASYGRIKRKFEEATAQLAKRDAELACLNVPFTTWRGPCGHLWNTEDTGIERCPMCAELTAANSRAEAAEQAAEQYRRNWLSLQDEIGQECHLRALETIRAWKAGSEAAEKLAGALEQWDGIGFDMWLTDDEWRGSEPDQDDPREWVNASAITREALTEYRAWKERSR